jgi:hypothetical protein
MGSISKGFSLLLVVILAVSSLIMVETVSAQSIPKPSIPEFTLRFVNSSYLIPETPYYQTDPYTGKQKYMGMQGGYLFKNYTIEISVKSQSFPSTINDTALQLYYNIRAKGLYEQGWSNLNLLSDDQVDRNYLPPQQNSEYTKISIPANTYTIGGTVELEVRAILGGVFSSSIEYNPFPFPTSYFGYEASDWSGAQSITISSNSVSNFTPNPTSSPTNTPSTPTPTVPEFPLLVILPFFVSLLLVAVYLKHRRTNHE